MSIGILGGGQLARMMILDGHRMGLYPIRVLDPTPGCPASQVGGLQTVGSFLSKDDVVAFGSECDIITVDLENVSIEGLKVLEEMGKKVHPSPEILELIKDKQIQKDYFKEKDIPTIPTLKYDGDDPTPFVFKRRVGGYDGKGVSLGEPFGDFGFIFPKGKQTHGIAPERGVEEHESDVKVMVEPKLNIEKELAVMVGVTEGQIKTFPLVETVQEDGICVLVKAPAKVSLTVERLALDLALRTVQSLPDPCRGVFGVEMFLLTDGSLVLNEVAPRPHNSGHYTLEVCQTSQFAIHLQAIQGLRLTLTDLKVPSVTMKNLIGVSLDEAKALAKDHNAFLHWYGKAEVRPGRKMGHLTTIGLTKPKVAVIMGSTSDLPTMAPAIDILREHEIKVIAEVISAHRDPEGMVKFAKEAEENDIKIIIAGAGGAAHLPGMVASLTHLPVIGVPVPTAHLGGTDSLYSIVQMPDGVPVATVGIGKAKNAGILALRMLGLFLRQSAQDSKAILKANLEKVKAQRETL